MIKIKEKKCKGTGIAKGYGCGELRTYRKYGLGKICCLRKWYLETEEGRNKINKTVFSVTKSRKSLERTEKMLKNKTQTSAALANTRIKVHKYVRDRDKYKPCISCKCDWNRDFEAGHLFSANNYRSIKFHLFNINGQCYECNHIKNGNEAQYLLNLPERIGKENVDELIILSEMDKRGNKNWTIEELEEIRNNISKLSLDLNL